MITLPRPTRQVVPQPTHEVVRRHRPDPCTSERRGPRLAWPCRGCRHRRHHRVAGYCNERHEQPPCVTGRRARTVSPPPDVVWRELRQSPPQRSAGAIFLTSADGSCVPRQRCRPGWSATGNEEPGGTDVPETVFHSPPGWPEMPVHFLPDPSGGRRSIGVQRLRGGSFTPGPGSRLGLPTGFGTRSRRTSPHRSPRR